MAKRSIPHVTVVILDFEQVARFSDPDVWGHVVQTCRLSRKRLIPKSVRYDGFRVSRGEKSVTAHLHFGETETMRFSFVPTPDFSRVGW